LLSNVEDLLLKREPIDAGRRRGSAARALQRVGTNRAHTEVRDALLLDCFNILREAHYGAVLHLRDSAADLGYPQLL